jgi:hypothetical protein
VGEIISQSPFIGLLGYFLYKERQRADKWEDTYIEDAKVTIATLTTVSTALTDIKQELRK